MVNENQLIQIKDADISGVLQSTGALQWILETETLTKSNMNAKGIIISKKSMDNGDVTRVIDFIFDTYALDERYYMNE